MTAGIALYLLGLLLGLMVWLYALRRFSLFSNLEKLTPLFHGNPKAQHNLQALRALLLATSRSFQEPERPVFEQTRLYLPEGATFDLGLARFRAPSEAEAGPEFDMYSRRMLHAALSATVFTSQSSPATPAGIKKIRGFS